MKWPPHELITTASGWRACLNRLRAEPRMAIDLEANSMYAYRERVCLIQISIPEQDYIVDPLAKIDLSGLGDLLADPAVEKVFHAAEYDLILMKREFGWTLQNLFDTMWAARILGYPRYGLANLIESFFGVKLNKRYQKSNWCKRPLSADQLTYAQLDTHFLLRLRDHLDRELAENGRFTEARHIFQEQTHVEPANIAFDPDDFWSISGAYDLDRQQQAILKELNIYRDQQAARRNRPLFKIFSDRTLIELARAAPATEDELQDIHGMSKGQIRRYGKQLLAVIQKGQQQPPPSPPKRNRRPPDDVIDRYERLHAWRKKRARQRGVESDVIISREALWNIAWSNPRSQQMLAQIDLVEEWRSELYGAEMMDALRASRK